MARRENYFGVESEQRGYSIRGRRSVAKIAGDGGRILNLHGAHLASRGLQAIESARQGSRDNFSPRSASAEDYVLGCGLDAPDFSQSGKIQHRPGQRPVAERGKNVCATGQDRGAGVCKNLEGILKRIRPKVQKRWLPDEAAAMRTFYFYNGTASL
jgi:hypothetical protein